MVHPTATYLEFKNQDQRSWFLRNLQKQVKNAFCFIIFFLPFTVLINCFTDLKNFASTFCPQHRISKVGQKIFRNKIPNQKIVPFFRFSTCASQTATTIHSYVPMEQFSTNSISFVIGGTMLIAQPLQISTH